MQFVIKLAISVCIIIFCTQIGRKFPSLAGLIATMPLTGAIVLFWLYSANKDDQKIIIDYSQGALWGLVPSVLFFLTAYLCFRRNLPLEAVIGACFGVWLLAAVAHQWFLR